MTAEVLQAPIGTIVHCYGMWCIITGTTTDYHWPAGYCFATDADYVGTLPEMKLGFYDIRYAKQIVPADALPDEILTKLAVWRMTR